VKDIALKIQPSEKYFAEGAATLIDRKTGSDDFSDAKWLGFQGENIDALLNMGSQTEIAKISLGFLNKPGSWIFPPKKIRVSASVDGERYVDVGALSWDQIMRKTVAGHNQLNIPVKPFKARFIKIEVENTGRCPAGHPGEGNPAWLFADEIIIE
jgi:hexosaminidase